MKKVEGVDHVVQVVGRWAPNDLAVIEGLELLNKSNTTDSDLVIKALFQARAASWPNFDKEMHRVIICFANARNLSLKDFGGGGMQILGFDIHFVGDRGLEGINYEIEDYEDNRISFSCESIRIQSAVS